MHLVDKLVELLLGLSLIRLILLILQKSLDQHLLLRLLDLRLRWSRLLYLLRVGELIIILLTESLLKQQLFKELVFLLLLGLLLLRLVLKHIQNCHVLALGLVLLLLLQEGYKSSRVLGIRSALVCGSLRLHEKLV